MLHRVVLCCVMFSSPPAPTLPPRLRAHSPLLPAGKTTYKALKSLFHFRKAEENYLELKAAAAHFARAYDEEIDDDDDDDDSGDDDDDGSGGGDGNGNGGLGHDNNDQVRSLNVFFVRGWLR